MPIVDEILEKAGAFGFYQFRQIFLIGGCSFIASFPFMVLVFSNIIPKHRCTLPDYGVKDTSYWPIDQLHNQSIHQYIPVDKDGGYESCTILLNETYAVNCDSYVYSKDDYDGLTITEKFDMICSGKALNTVSKVCFSVGLVFGAALIGILSDSIGRRRAIIGTILIGNVCGVIAMFSINIYMYIVLRMLIGFCFVGCIVCTHVLMLELTAPSRRTVAMAMRMMFWPSGCISLSLIAYYIKDWNWLQLAITVPAWIHLLIVALFLKESPHWLVSKGKHREAVDLFHHISSVNNKVIPDSLLNQLHENEEKRTTERFMTIFRASTLLKRFAVFLYLWFVSGLGYYGLSYNVGNLTGDVYVNNALISAAELPVFLFILLSKTTGRRKTCISVLFIGAVSLVACAVMNAYLDLDVYGMAVVAVAMIGKLAVSILFAFAYFWSSEVFPSTLRTTLVGFCSLLARIGSMAAPAIVDLNQYVTTRFGAGLGAMIFGITMFIGGLAALTLPETNNRKVPESIAEANVFMTSSRQETDTEEEEVKLSKVEVELNSLAKDWKIGP